MEQTSAEILDYTGERMVPEATGYNTFWEHIYRYRFATQFVKGKRVLDIACGEGYGTYGLQKAGAVSVVGVDIAQEAVDHARKKYGIDARLGDALAIPLEDNSVDVVVTYETVEHVSSPQKFLKECRRVLVSGGQLIISTPNRDIYSEFNNPFHCAEMNEAEFIALLDDYCSEWDLYTQYPRWALKTSLRSLGARDSGWAKVRRIKPVSSLLNILLTPNLSEGATQQWQNKPIEAIFDKDRPLAAFAHPYSIWKRNKANQEKPEYFVAVATMKKK